MRNADVMSRIYTELYNVVAPKVGDKPPAEFLCLFTVGRTVKYDFDVRSLMDAIPKVNKSYAESGNRVTGAYSTALSAHFSQGQPHTENEIERYNAAVKTLFNDFDTEDEEISSKYARFRKAKRKWERARNALHAAKNNPNYPKKATDDFPSIRDLQDDIDDAYEDMQMAYMDEVECALMVFYTYNSFSPAAFILRLQDKLTREHPYPITTEPVDWTHERAWKKLAWTKVEIKVASESSVIHTDVMSVQNEFDSKYKNGLWFFSEWRSEEHMDYFLSKNLQTTTTTDKLSISLDLAEVTVNRDWLDTTFFTFEDVYIDGQSAGSITKGSLSAADIDNAVMPLIPVTLVLARDVKIYDDFCEEVTSFIQTAKGQSGANTHFGPFGSGTSSTKHSTSESYSHEERNKYPQTSKIEFPGVQLIGIKCTVTSPKFPQKDAPK